MASVMLSIGLTSLPVLDGARDTCIDGMDGGHHRKETLAALDTQENARR